MTHRAFASPAIRALALALLVCVDAPATTYYWDTNGATSGIGSAGGGTTNWLTSSWATSDAGNQPTGAWPNSQPANSDEAVFQGTAGTVSANADVYANALRFQTNNYTISSTGGSLQLVGDDPRITVNLASNNQVVTISAPIAGEGGGRGGGDSLSGGFKFLVLANADAAHPNSFAGTLSIEAGGALRLGGGVAREQIPDDVDMHVAGVVDFITSGGASDGKQERVRNVSVSGSNAIFSVGNGSDFIVNSISGDDAQNISINGNNASVPGKLSITGWEDGSGNLTLHSSTIRLNTTGAQVAIGGRVVLSGDIQSSGESQVINFNGGGGSVPEWDDNVFTHRAFDFAGAEHTINVADGTLTFTSRAPSHPLEITTLQPAGAVITKTGAGTLRLENAVQTDFSGATQVLEGTLSLARPALADAADLHVETGATLELGFDGIDVVESLFIDGVSRPAGTWGSLTSNADFKSSHFAGTGILQVATYLPPVLAGDFNADGIVDAADYTVWRDSLGNEILPGSGADGTGPEGIPDGVVDQFDYQLWKSSFGNASGLGAADATSPVPEPSAFALLVPALAFCVGRPRKYVPT